MKAKIDMASFDYESEDVHFGLAVAKRIADKISTADVVEVVRCKDCRHYVAEYCTRDIKSRTNMFYMCADDFCSYGERKDEE